MSLLSAKRTRMVIAFDLLILLELTVCMYWACKSADAMTVVFLSTYLPIALATLVIGKFCLNKFAPVPADTDEMKGQSECSTVNL